LPVVPLDEQKAIAVFLDRETAKIDALIAEQERLIALLAEKRQATISHAVTKGLDPKAPMKDSGVAWLGDVPAHWDVRPLKHLVQLKSGGTPSKENPAYWDGGIPWASAKDLKVEQLHDTADHISQAAVDDGAASLVPQGAVLVVVRGMILARMFPVVEATCPMAINQDLKAVVPNRGLDTSFLAWLLRGSATESLTRLDEAGHGTKALRMDAWTSMNLPIPPQPEQLKLAEFISAETAKLDSLCTEADKAVTLLKERRSALIAAAVTGQIDVRNA
jgi:type I restriction enzyme S subunit